MNFSPELRNYEEELNLVTDKQNLNNFSSLVQLLKSFYSEELASLPSEQNKKFPVRQDKILIARNNNLDEFARKCLLSPIQFTGNLMHSKKINVAPSLNEIKPIQLA